MTQDFVQTPAIQTLLDVASGMTVDGGDTRFKHIIRDLIEAAMSTIVKCDINIGRAHV